MAEVNWSVRKLVLLTWVMFRVCLGVYLATFFCQVALRDCLRGVSEALLTWDRRQKAPLSWPSISANESSSFNWKLSFPMEADILKKMKTFQPISCSFNCKWLLPYGCCHFRDSHLFRVEKRIKFRLMPLEVLNVAQTDHGGRFDSTWKKELEFGSQLTNYLSNW